MTRGWGRAVGGMGRPAGTSSGLGREKGPRRTRCYPARLCRSAAGQVVTANHGTAQNRLERIKCKHGTCNVPSRVVDSALPLLPPHLLPKVGKRRHATHLHNMCWQQQLGQAGSRGWRLLSSNPTGPLPCNRQPTMAAISCPKTPEQVQSPTQTIQAPTVLPKDTPPGRTAVPQSAAAGRAPGPPAAAPAPAAGPPAASAGMACRPHRLVVKRRDHGLLVRPCHLHGMP